MPIPLIVLALAAFFGAANRISHRTEFVHKHQAWVLKNYPGSEPLTKRELYLACLDDSKVCEIVPEIEKASRAAEVVSKIDKL